MKNLFYFRQATIGFPTNINGVEFNFFYSLHTIPCIGFIANYEEKSIYFSGDTFYNPEKMKELFLDKGLMT